MLLNLQYLIAVFKKRLNQNVGETKKERLMCKENMSQQKKKKLPCVSRRHDINTYQESASEKVEGRHDPLFSAVLSHF